MSNPTDKPTSKSWVLWLEFLKITTFTLGGGAVMLPLMEEVFVRKLKYLSPKEMLDIFTMVNSMPGVIAVNSSVLIGYKVRGFRGATAALLGVIVVPVIIIMLLSVGISQIRDLSWVQAGFHGIRAAVTGLMVTVLLRMASKTVLCWIDLAIAVTSFFLMVLFEVPGLIIIAGAAVMGWALHTLRDRRNQ